MSTGAFALYVDQQAGGGPNAPIDRVVPLPRVGGDGEEPKFDHRRLTLSYDNLPPTAPASVNVTGRFLGVANSPINVTINAGQCVVVAVPRDACAAALHVNPAAAGTVRGPLSALVEYSD
jgi:hypothetical protein